MSRWHFAVFMVIMGMFVSIVFVGIAFALIFSGQAGQPFCDKLQGNENMSVYQYIGADILTNPSQHFCEYNRTYNNYTYNHTAFRDALSHTEN